MRPAGLSFKTAPPRSGLELRWILPNIQSNTCLRGALEDARERNTGRAECVNSVEDSLRNVALADTSHGADSHRDHAIIHPLRSAVRPQGKGGDGMFSKPGEQLCVPLW